jgi:hypothetical protein
MFKNKLSKKKRLKFEEIKFYNQYARKCKRNMNFHYKKNMLRTLCDWQKIFVFFESKKNT